MRCGSMSNLKNHLGFLMTIYLYPGVKGLLDDANNGVNLTINKKNNRFY